jgi:hypothetical protein
MNAATAAAVRPGAWKPTPDEVRRIVDEMRPIIQDFARRARQSAAAANSPPPPHPRTPPELHDWRT